MLLRGFRVPVRFIAVHTETTPNPEALIFYLEKGKDVLGDQFKSKQFTDKYSCSSSPLAMSLFKIHGVDSVLLGSKHITIKKKPEMAWSLIKPNLELVISQFFETGMPVARPDSLEPVSRDAKTTEIEGRIKGLLQERVRPFVQQDGGDIEFVGFDEESGFVTVRLQGACSGCPKSAVTLKLGIERMLKHYIPEITAVINVGDEEGGAKTEADQEGEGEENVK